MIPWILILYFLGIDSALFCIKCLQFIFSENLNLPWRPLRVSCPYKAWKPQLVLAAHLWHSPCKRQHTSARLHQRPVECHSMWKHPEHLIITLIEPARQIWRWRGLRLAYLRLQQHHVWLAPVHTGWTFRHHQALGAQPWWWWGWCARLSNEAGVRSGARHGALLVRTSDPLSARESLGECHGCAARESHTSEVVKPWFS